MSGISELIMLLIAFAKSCGHCCQRGCTRGHATSGKVGALSQQRVSLYAQDFPPLFVLLTCPLILPSCDLFHQ